MSYLLFLRNDLIFLNISSIIYDVNKLVYLSLRFIFFDTFLYFANISYS